MSNWLDDLLVLGTGNDVELNGARGKTPQACVLVSVVHTRGSCPRDAGTRMIVTLDSRRGTIGGGHLEFQAIDLSRQLLFNETSAFRIERFPLGARLGQCCGGVAHLSFEFIPARSPSWIAALQDIRNSGRAAIMVTSIDDTPQKLIVSEQTFSGCLADKTQQQRAVSRARAILGDASPRLSLREDSLLYEKIDGTSMRFAIFGAGHVGKAVVDALSPLPCQIVWIDSRVSEFPARVPGNVRVEISEQPENEIDDVACGSHVVIMTHSHALDMAICERALRRDDLAWCGLIGSKTKRRQFEKRLLPRGLSEAAMARLVCPIGIDGIAGKHPAQIAIAVAAQVLQSANAQRRIDVSDHQAA